MPEPVAQAADIWPRNFRAELLSLFTEFRRGLAQDEQCVIDRLDDLFILGECSEVHCMSEALAVNAVENVFEAAYRVARRHERPRTRQRPGPGA